MDCRGIILAGGTGSRLFPCTLTVSKQLMPVYDKPTIYYPLSALMLAEIRNITIISTPRDIPMIRDLLKDGKHLGLELSYIIQEKPNGIAEAFILAEKNIAGHNCCLILGDNIFYGNGLITEMNHAKNQKEGAVVFGYSVENPQQYGVVEFKDNGRPARIIEKPANPPSNYAVTGLYFYDSNVVQYAKSLKPSARGELEITDLNNIYLEKERLSVAKLGRGICWFDVGTHDALLECSNFVRTVESRQGLKIGCPEEIALNKGWITGADIPASLLKADTVYSRYLRQLIRETNSPIS